MLDAVYKSLEETFLKFNLRRLVFLLFIFILIIGSLYIFEFFTGYCYLSQIHKMVETTEQLFALERAGIMDSSSLSNVYSELVETVSKYDIHTVSTSVDLYPLIKFLAATIIPIIVIIMAIASILRGDAEGKDMLLGGIVIAVICGFAGVMIPTLGRSWINPVVYLVINLLVVVAVSRSPEKGD